LACGTTIRILSDWANIHLLGDCLLWVKLQIENCKSSPNFLLLINTVNLLSWFWHKMDFATFRTILFTISSGRPVWLAMGRADRAASPAADYSLAKKTFIEKQVHPQKFRYYKLESWDRCYNFWKVFAEKFGVFYSIFVLQVCTKKIIITLVFMKKAIFFAENWEKSLKNVIITSTPALQYVCMQRVSSIGYFLRG
jgi:hypothetical protein